MQSERLFRFRNYTEPSFRLSTGRAGNASPATAGGRETNVVGPSQAEAKGLRADAARNHERILAAAEEVFAREGLAVPIDVVAARAGVGVGTLYRHFPTKESLFEAIVLARVGDLAEQAHSVAAAPNPGDALFAFLQHLGRQMSGKHDLVDAMTSAGIDVKSECSGRIDEMQDQLEIAVTRAQRQGRIRADVTAKELVALLGAAVHAGDLAPGAEAVERLVGIVCDGIRARPS